MALSDLSPADVKVYEYLKLHDFVKNAWSTSKAAKALKIMNEKKHVKNQQAKS